MVRLACKTTVAAAGVLVALATAESLAAPGVGPAQQGLSGAPVVAGAAIAMPSGIGEAARATEHRRMVAASDGPRNKEQKRRHGSKARMANDVARSGPLDPARPVATYPGFAMLAGGKSRVWVAVNKNVAVEQLGTGRVRSFLLVGTQIGPRNNTNPLITTHFPTPLARAQLRRHVKGTELVLWLRDDVEVSMRSVSGPKGSITVEVELPPRPSSGNPRSGS